MDEDTNTTPVESTNEEPTTGDASIPVDGYMGDDDLDTSMDDLDLSFLDEDGDNEE